MNHRDIKLDQYNISVYAYRELANFCLQYPEKKRALAEARNPLRPMRVSEAQHSRGRGDPTAAAAERAIKLSGDCDLIEQTAIEADGDIYQWVLLAVTKGISYRHLRECDIDGIGKLPAGEELFGNRRRKFFYLLAKKKGVI